MDKQLDEWINVGWLDGRMDWWTSGITAENPYLKVIPDIVTFPEVAGFLWTNMTSCFLLQTVTHLQHLKHTTPPRSTPKPARPSVTNTRTHTHTLWMFFGFFKAHEAFFLTSVSLRCMLLCADWAPSSCLDSNIIKCHHLYSYSAWGEREQRTLYSTLMHIRHGPFL